MALPFVPWRAGLSIVLLGLLCSVGSVHADETADVRADSLTAAEVAFDLRYGFPTPRAPRRDRWIAKDKLQHVVFSGLWTLSAQYVLVNKSGWSEEDAIPASIASGAAMGIAKELYDTTQPKGTVSGKDLVADGVGIGLAVGLILL